MTAVQAMVAKLQGGAHADDQSGTSFPPPGFSWVVENTIGGMRAPTCADNVLSLQKLNVGLVVNLTEHPYEFELTEQHLNDAQMTVIHIPVIDYSVPTIGQVIQYIEAVQNTINRNKAVVVHCHAGMGRTGTFIACYLLHHFPEKTPQEVIQYVRSKRPGSITTKQETIIQEYYQHLKNNKKTDSLS